jgi:hypothetical protein
MRSVAIRSSALALCATLAALPYLHLLATAALEKGRFPKGFEYWEFLFTQLLLLFILCLLSAVIGFSFSKRFGLPGFGSWRKLLQHLPLLLSLGAFLIALSYVVFDRRFVLVSPKSYPSDPIHLLLLPLKGALTEETILRLCLVTLCVGFLRRKISGVVAASTIGALFTWKYFQFIGAAVGFNTLFTAQMVLAFIVNVVLGYLFVTEGLIYAITLKFILGLKYVLVCWIHG